MFRKLDLFLSSDEGREAPTLLGPLERANLSHWTGLDWNVRMSEGPSKIYISLHSPEEGNCSSFRNVVFHSCLEFRKRDKVYKASDFETCNLVKVKVIPVTGLGGL
jgi:hypothetical protein